MNALAMGVLGKLWATGVRVPMGCRLGPGHLPRGVIAWVVESTENKIASLGSENANHLGLGPRVSGCSSDSPAMTTVVGNICAQSPWGDSAKPEAPRR